jgi:hypothetical protein
VEAQEGRDGDGTRSEGQGEAVRRQYHPRWPAACRGHGMMLRDWTRSRFEVSAAGGVWRNLQKRTIISSSCTAAPHARSPDAPAGYTRCAWIKKVQSDSRACGRGLRSVSALARRLGAGRGALRPERGGPSEMRGRGRARAFRGWRGLCRREQIVGGDGQEGMLMKAGGQVRDSLGRRGVGQDAAWALRGKDIGECRFKGTAAGQLSTDWRGEGCAAWPCSTGRVGAGGAAGPRSCGALRRAEDASAREPA